MICVPVMFEHVQQIRKRTRTGTRPRMMKMRAMGKTKKTRITTRERMPCRFLLSKNAGVAAATSPPLMSKRTRKAGILMKKKMAVTMKTAPVRRRVRMVRLFD